MWINPNKSVTSLPQHVAYHQDKSSLQHQQQHLYINKICPPDYSELEGRSSYRNINHCSQSSSQGQYYASTNIMDKVHSFNPSLPGNPTGSDLSCGSDQSGNGNIGHKLQNLDTTSSCSSRQSDSYKSRSDSGSQGSHGAGLFHHDPRMISSGRFTDPGLPPPVPPMRGPSSYNAANFNSFGTPYSDNIYGYQYGSRGSGYIYAPSSNNHYETASIYQENLTKSPRFIEQGKNFCCKLKIKVFASLFIYPKKEASKHQLIFISDIDFL